MSNPGGLGIRWTVGNVSARGFEALQLSIWGAWRIFGSEAAYCVCVNTIGLDRARAMTGELPLPITWRDTTMEIPSVVREHMDAGMAEGCGWKLAPLRLFPSCYELSLDNDCILWDLPEALRVWLSGEQPGRCVMAQDVKACFGQFSGQCGGKALNAGIRGLPPSFNLDDALGIALRRRQAELGESVMLSSELDEQGLQTAALSLRGEPLVVTLEEVTVCSPFWPHLPHLGRCGAHFVGLNAPHIAWRYYDRPADEWMTEHWEKHKPVLCERVGLALSSVAG
jgi:hypothetical protein